MQGRIIFLLEEPSMKVLLDGLLPRLFSGREEGRHFQCLAHDGKSDLERSIRVKLRAWRVPKALASAFPQQKLDTPTLRKRFAQPDAWRKPSVELERLIPRFQKRSGARLMAEHLQEDRSNSPSFHSFANGVRRLALEMGHPTQP